MLSATSLWVSASRRQGKHYFRQCTSLNEINIIFITDQGLKWKASPTNYIPLPVISEFTPSVLESLSCKKKYL